MGALIRALLDVTASPATRSAALVSTSGLLVPKFEFEPQDTSSAQYKCTHCMTSVHPHLQSTSTSSVSYDDTNCRESYSAPSGPQRPHPAGYVHSEDLKQY